MSVENFRVSVVTGAKQGGIGFEVARQLAQEGVVYLTAHRREDAIAAARILESEGCTIDADKLDVTDQRDVERIINKAVARDRRVNTLINSAAVFPDDDRNQKITRVLPSTVREIFEVNTLGTLRMIQAVLPGMEGENFGRIVQVFGSWGSYARAFEELGGRGGGYGLAKAAETYLVPAVAADLLNRGFTDILINAVDPGKVKTNMNPGGQRSSQEAAHDVVELAMLPRKSGIMGKLFRNGVEVLFDSYTPNEVSSPK